MTVLVMIQIKNQKTRRKTKVKRTERRPNQCFLQNLGARARRRLHFPKRKRLPKSLQKKKNKRKSETNMMSPEEIPREHQRHRRKLQQRSKQDWHRDSRTLEHTPLAFLPSKMIRFQRHSTSLPRLQASTSQKETTKDLIVDSYP